MTRRAHTKSWKLAGLATCAGLVATSALCLRDGPRVAEPMLSVATAPDSSAVERESTETPRASDAAEPARRTLDPRPELEAERFAVLCSLATALSDPELHYVQWERELQAASRTFEPGDVGRLCSAVADRGRSVAERLAAAEVVRVLDARWAAEALPEGQDGGPAGTALELDPVGLEFLRRAAVPAGGALLPHAVAARSLAAFGDADDHARLLLALSDPDSERAFATAWALQTARRPGLALELAALACSDGALGSAPLAGRPRACGAALVALDGLMRSPTAERRFGSVREDVAQSVGELGADPHARVDVRVRCTVLLGALGGSAASAALARVLDQPEAPGELARAAARAFVACEGASALDWSRELALRAGRAGFELSLALAEGAPVLREAPAVQAGLLDGLSRAAASAERPEDRRSAIRALARLGDPASAALFERLAVEDEDELVREVAREARAPAR